MNCLSLKSLLSLSKEKNSKSITSCLRIIIFQTRKPFSSISKSSTHEKDETHGLLFLSLSMFILVMNKMKSGWTSKSIMNILVITGSSSLERTLTVAKEFRLHRQSMMSSILLENQSRNDLNEPTLCRNILTNLCWFIRESLIWEYMEFSRSSLVNRKDISLKMAI